MNAPLNLPEVLGIPAGHRRMVRVTRSQELAIRSRHRRRKGMVRGGVLVGFALAMVIYPMFGTLSPAANAAGSVPGVVLGEIPTTLEVVLGEAPGLTAAALDTPVLEDTARSLALSSDYVVSTYLPYCDGSTEWEGTNGALTPDSLCVLWDGKNMVRSDAAVALAQLNHAFKLTFGRDICMTSSYRSLDDQYRVKRLRGRMAARPGQSYHGWGLAVDVCPGDDRGEHFQWLKDNGAAFGWVNPRWASSQMYEPWHFEYAPGTALVGWASVPGSYDDGTYGDGGNTTLPDITVDPDPVPSPTPTPEPVPSPTPSP